MFDFKCTKAMLLLIRGKGKCRTFFMIKKTHCASDTSIILCNVYIVSQHFIPNCIATTFSFTQTFLVCPVGGEKPQENSFYFLSSWSNLTKSGGNFSSWFCKNSGAAPVQWSDHSVVEAGRVVGQENTQSHVSVSLTDCQRQEQTPSVSSKTLYNL